MLLTNESRWQQQYKKTEHSKITVKIKFKPHKKKTIEKNNNCRLNTTKMRGKTPQS